MTAQVAVLTSRGVALASDSAVTIGDGRQSRSYQSADKIFPVHGTPLAVLHSGNAEIWGVPWQLLVEMWAQKRDPAEAESMRAYANEFRSWLESQSNLATPEAQDDFLRWCFRDYMLTVRAAIRSALDLDDDDRQPGRLQGEQEQSVDAVVATYVEVLSSRPQFVGSENLDAQAICDRIGESLMEDLAWVFDDTPGTMKLAEDALVIARLLVTKAEPFMTDAVLAFVGYGRDDYFPSIVRMTVSGVVGGSLRTYDESEDEVGSDSKVSIVPLGLTEAIHAFLRGVSPQYRQAAHRVLDAHVALDKGDGGDPEVDPHTRLDEEFDSIEWTEFLSPMLDIVQTLPLAETVRLAESLVGLASLRQLIQGKASVGGPVDVARVTKQAGFEWVRSKHRTPA